MKGNKATQKQTPQEPSTPHHLFLYMGVLVSMKIRSDLSILLPVEATWQKDTYANASTCILKMLHNQSVTVPVKCKVTVTQNLNDSTQGEFKIEGQGIKFPALKRWLGVFFRLRRVFCNYIY